MDQPLRETAIAEIQLTARRWHVHGHLPAELFTHKTDAEILAWVRRLAALEFAQRFDPPHERRQ